MNLNTSDSFLFKWCSIQAMSNSPRWPQITTRSKHGYFKPSWNLPVIYLKAVCKLASDHGNCSCCKTNTQHFRHANERIFPRRVPLFGWTGTEIICLCKLGRTKMPLDLPTVIVFCYNLSTLFIVQWQIFRPSPICPLTMLKIIRSKWSSSMNLTWPIKLIHEILKRSICGSFSWFMALWFLFVAIIIYAQLCMCQIKTYPLSNDRRVSNECCWICACSIGKKQVWVKALF